MSLISEALKRARLEAAHQEAAREGRPYAPPLHIPERRRSWPLLAAGLAVGVLLVGGVGAGLYLGSRSHGPAAPAPPPASAGAAATAPSIPRPISREIASPMGPLASTPPPPARPDPTATQGNGGNAAQSGRDRTVEPVPAPRPAAPPSSPFPVETRAATAPEPSRPAAPSPRRERPATASAPPATIAAGAASAAGEAGDDGPSYHREAALPGGAKLQLSGIAYSDTAPVALINGKVVGPGEVIEGYTVVAIEAKRVEMQGRGGTLYLLLR